MNLVVEALGPDDPRGALADALLADALPGQGFSLAAEAGKPEGLALVASLDGRIAGAFVGWVVVDELHVLSIATAAWARRRGAGKALLDEAFARAHGRGARRALLEVARGNAGAIALYRRAGFHVMAVRRGYYANGEDAVELDVRWDDDRRVSPGTDDEELDP